MTECARRRLARATSDASRIAIVLLFLLVATRHAGAQEQFPSLTLAEFSGLVREGLPDNTLVQAAVLDAEADLERARALSALDVSLERQQVFVDGEGVVLQNSASLGWSFDLSGRRGLRIEAANANLRAVQLQSTRAHALIEFKATALYLQAARARQRLESLRRSRKPLAKLTNSLTRRAEEGDVSGADAARFALALSDLDDGIAKAEAEREVAEGHVAALLGRPGRVVASDDLALPRRPAQAPNRSPATRPDLRAADIEVVGGRALIRAAARWWVPTVDVAAGWLSTDFGPGSGPGGQVAHGYLATLSLGLPVFSRAEADRKRGEANVSRAMARKAVLERRMNAESRAAHTRLQAHIDRIDTLESKRLPLAIALVEKTEAAYSGGETTALELRDAHEKLADARLRAIDLRYSARLAELQLWRAQGVRPEGAAK